MSEWDAPVKPVGTTRRRRWPRRLGIGFGVLFVFLLIFYFVATSAWSIKTFVLPRVSKMLNARVTVGDASLSPFSSIELKRLRVRNKGGAVGVTPIFRVGKALARYSLWVILGGNIDISEVIVEAPVVGRTT